MLFTNFLEIHSGWGVAGLRTLAALAEDQSLDPSIHLGYLTIASNSSLEDLVPSSGLYGHLHA